MAKNLGNMRIYQIVKDDSVYNSALKIRLARLEMYKSDLLAGNLGKEVNKSINLTKECHQIAGNLKSTCIHLAKLFPTDTTTALDQLIASQMKAAAKSKDSKDLFPREMIESALLRKHRDYEIAKQLLLEVINGRGNKNKTMLDVVDKKFPEDGSFERVSLRMNIALLSTHYQSYMSAISVSTDFINLAEIFRGLLYMGIIDYHGSELNEKELENHLMDFAKETAGVFLPPLASNIIGLVNMLNRVVDVIMDLHGAEV
ncbi:MAG TPA: hypothetical protein PK989_12660, partial [Anaerolineales bacterium]|nr:hypothetical protein [Anaerolineales bacterium]